MELQSALKNKVGCHFMRGLPMPFPANPMTVEYFPGDNLCMTSLTIDVRNVHVYDQNRK